MLPLAFDLLQFETVSSQNLDIDLFALYLGRERGDDLLDVFLWVLDYRFGRLEISFSYFHSLNLVTVVELHDLATELYGVEQIQSLIVSFALH